MTNRFAEFRRRAASAVAALAVSSILITAAVGYAVVPQTGVVSQGMVA